jgi:hypothetical protein
VVKRECGAHAGVLAASAPRFVLFCEVGLVSFSCTEFSRRGLSRIVISQWHLIGLRLSGVGDGIIGPVMTTPAPREPYILLEVSKVATYQENSMDVTIHNNAPRMLPHVTQRQRSSLRLGP